MAHLVVGGTAAGSGIREKISIGHALRLQPRAPRHQSVVGLLSGLGGERGGEGARIGRLPLGSVAEGLSAIPATARRSRR
jgi:hypothetical protein